jgi:hypothetical protein
MSIAMATAPLQALIAAGIVLALFAPRLLPPVGRLLGRIAAREMRRRYGVRLAEPRERESRPRNAEEVLVPRTRGPSLRAGHTDSLAASVQTSAVGSQPRVRWRPWRGLLVVSAAVAVLLWYLLHPR